jgi:hypothetical protein
VASCLALARSNLLASASATTFFSDGVDASGPSWSIRVAAVDFGFVDRLGVRCSTATSRWCSKVCSVERWRRAANNRAIAPPVPATSGGCSSPSRVWPLLAGALVLRDGNRLDTGAHTRPIEHSVQVVYFVAD